VRGLLVILGLAAAVVIAVVIAWMLRQPSGRGPGAADIEANNRGVGLMGRYDYEPARAVFQDLADRHPDWHDVHVNLAIAVLNRQNDGDTAAALGILDGVLSRDPDHLRAMYCAALLRLFEGDVETALRGFTRVAEADPADAYAAYYTAFCHAQLQSYEEAARWYERAAALDGYLRSAAFGLSQVYRRLGREGDADAALTRFQRLEGNPRARLVQFVYGRMGRRGEARAVDVQPPAPPAAPAGDLFGTALGLTADRAAFTWIAPGARRPSITATDLNGDSILDLFFAGALEIGGAPGNAVFVGDGRGGYALDLGHPLAAIPQARAALWGDLDNDGLTDCYLCRHGSNRMFRQAEPGVFEDVTAASGAAGADLDTVDGACFDADHDGDLDLFCVNADGPDELFNNNLDGTFSPIGASSGLDGGGRASRGVLVGDFDDDRDADIAVLHEQPPHAVYLNDRLWSYQPAEGFDAFAQSVLAAAVVADADADGEMELHGVDRLGAVHRFARGAAGRWEWRPLWTPPGPPARRGGAAIAIADVDGDGPAEILVSAGDSWTVLSGDGSSVRFEAREPVAGWTLVTNPAEGPEVVGLGEAGPLVWPAGPGRHEFLGLRLSGRLDTGAGPPPMRSNASGVGARVACRADSRWAIHSGFRQDSGPGQSLQPMAVGLGGAAHLDFVSIDWSDGVLQTEVHGLPAMPDGVARDFGPGHVETIEELQRVKSSCPVVFAWDGARYAFVSDILGVGGLGFAVAPGAYGPSRPWERFLLPAGRVAPLDGSFQIKIAEPMEEACYLDAVRLIRYTLPPGWSMTVDERFAIAGPEPTGEPRFYRESRGPVAARNDRGQDVLDVLLRADGVAADPGPLDRRFIGRLAADHALTLEFESPLDAAPGAPHLIADGWIEYPYSQTMIAAHQARAEYRAPTLEARAGGGAWRVVQEQFGYPAGMPRQMCLPLADLPPGTTALRLTTNQEIYWDRIAVAWVEPCPAAVRSELPLQEALLRRSGFAPRPDLPQRRPDYDYAARVPLWDTRHQRGWYTAFGDVRELVGRSDDAVAILGPGEEVHLRFAAADHGSVAAGWTRRLVLEAEGWCKDMDLHTQAGETIEPVPRAGRGDPAAAEALHRRFNTRYESGR
jgi:tetratricopeptide (TPR) repeat protein